MKNSCHIATVRMGMNRNIEGTEGDKTGWNAELIWRWLKLYVFRWAWEGWEGWNVEGTGQGLDNYGKWVRMGRTRWGRVGSGDGGGSNGVWWKWERMEGKGVKERKGMMRTGKLIPYVPAVLVESSTMAYTTWTLWPHIGTDEITEPEATQGMTRKIWLQIALLITLL